MCLFALCVFGCEEPSQVAATPKQETLEPTLFTANKEQEVMATPKTPTPTGTFIPGLPLTPAAKLLAWLNTELEATPRRRVRFPVVVRFKDKERYTIQDAFIGAAADAEPEPDTIFLALDDSRMGIPLDTYLRTVCLKSAIACAVWLEGQWGKSVAGGHLDTGKESSAWPFAVRAVHGIVEGSSDGSRIFVESLPP